MIFHLKRFARAAPLSILIALLMGCSAPEDVQFTVPSEYRAAVDALIPLIEEQMTFAGITGLSIALVEDQEIIWSAGFGYANKGQGIKATPETVYRVGSISKLFTALAAVTLAEEGQLDLDAPITDCFPEFKLNNPFEDDKFITVRHLLSHTAGIQCECPVGNYSDNSEPSIEETVKSLIGSEKLYKTGERTNYSNIGYTIVGYLVERVSGIPFEQYVRDNLLDPMGMTSSDFLLSERVRPKLSQAFIWLPDGYTTDATRITAPVFELGIKPAGNLYSTAEDLTKFHSMVFAGGRVADKSIVEAASLGKMLEKQRLLDGSEGDFGLGFLVDERNGESLYGHDGAVYGFSSAFAGTPEHRLGAVVLCNEDSSSSIVNLIADRALDQLMQVKGIEVEIETKKREIEADYAKMLKLLGEYDSGVFWAKIAFENEDFRLYLAGVPHKLKFYEDGSARAYSRAAGSFSPDFAEDAEGNPIGFDLGPYQFRRIRSEYPDVPDPWNKYVGTYGPAYDPIIVTIKYGRLFAFIENQADHMLTPIDGAVFKLRSGFYAGETVEFVLGEDGEPSHLILSGVRFSRNDES